MWLQSQNAAREPRGLPSALCVRGPQGPASPGLCDFLSEASEQEREVCAGWGLTAVQYWRT